MTFSFLLQHKCPVNAPSLYGYGLSEPPLVNAASCYLGTVQSAHHSSPLHMDIVYSCRTAYRRNVYNIEHLLAHLPETCSDILYKSLDCFIKVSDRTSLAVTPIRGDPPSGASST